MLTLPGNHSSVGKSFLITLFHFHHFILFSPKQFDEAYEVKNAAFDEKYIPEDVATRDEEEKDEKLAHEPSP